MYPASSANNVQEEPALKALRVSESRYRRLFETAQDGILLLNADTAQIEDVNPYLINMLGYSHAEFLGKKLWEVGSFVDIAQSKEMFEVLQSDGYVRYSDLPLKTKAGTEIAVEFVSNNYDCAGTKVIQCNIRDISERKVDQANILRHKQLYAALSQCNKAIVHCTSEQELFLEAVRAAVQYGGMKMAWIGLIDKETRMLQPVASFGDDTGYLKDICISTDTDSQFGHGPTGTAIRETEPVWCQDFLHDPATQLWHERAAHAGYAASASLPLHREGVVVGALTLYSATINSFDEPARNLQMEIASDISFALGNFAHNLQRMQAQEEIKLKNTILKTQQETSLDAILVIDESGNIISYNQRFISLWQLPVQLVSARAAAPVLNSVADQVENPEEFIARVQYLSEHRDEKSRDEITLKDGRIIDRYSAAAIGEDHKYYGIVWYFRDISEHKKANQMFKDLLESAPDAMVIVNQNNKIMLVNAQVSKLFGWSNEELIRQCIDMLLPERFREQHPQMQKDFFAHPHIRPMGAGLDLFGLHKDGNEFPVEISLSPLETADGTLVICTIHNITARKHGERLMRDSEKRFKAIFDQAPIAMALIDSQGLPIVTNIPLSKMTGYSSDELSRMKFSDFTYAEDVDSDMSLFTELMAGNISSYQMEKRYVHKDGHLIWANLFINLLRDEKDLPQDVIAMAEDITERKNAEARISFLNRVYAVLSGINSLIVRAPNRDELFKEACRIAVETGGFRMAMISIVNPVTNKLVPMASTGKDELLISAIKNILLSDELSAGTMVARVIREKKPIISNDSQHDPQVFFSQKYTDAGVRSMAVFPLIVADEAIGTLALYASESNFFHDEELKLLKELAGDISFAVDHIDKQERINYLAYYDVLTGLANRNLFLERVTQYMRSASSSGNKLALFMIDLERFKSINDSLGRTAGDALLVQVAEWLTHNLSDINLLARVGADHFAVVLPDVNLQDDLSHLVEKTMNTFLGHPFRLNDAVFRIAAKVGIALFPDDGTDADTLYKNAEAALKNAKASGERYLFHTLKMTESVSARLTLENQLRQAIDNEEFELYYQPKINLVSGTISSAEALIRWNDPRMGLVPPDSFIPILEDTGLIHEVGRWALHKAISEYLRRRAAGLTNVRIAVNVSPLQLRNRGFIDEIKQALSIDAHAAEGLELEITESLIMEDIKHSIASLQAIRAMGVTIAIDDFGTGFSSLSYLSKLPIDTLKIDRSFIIDMTAGPEGLALVATIISLAHSLKLKVVAEGVETEEQSRMLRLLNCDEIQGYLFSKPVPGQIFETKFLMPPA